MKERAFWFVSLTFVLSALCLHVNALSKASVGVQVFSQAMAAGDGQKSSLKAEADHVHGIANILRTIAVPLAFVSAVCLFISYQRDEPASRFFLVGLLAAYVFLQFAVV